MVVTGTAHAPLVRGQLPKLADHNLITEPSPKDSSAAIGLAAALLELRDPDAIIASFAADHVIRGSVLFERAVRTAVNAAAEGSIVTIGIHPTFASTGFGYIRGGSARTDLAPFDVYDVEEFVEKPDQDTADRYLADGGYLWNAGMFIAGASVLLDTMALAEPELVASLRNIAAVWDSPEGAQKREELWPSLTKVAIDYSVAEPSAAAGNMVCVSAHFEWDDVGDIDSVAKLLTR